ncbi:MAG TPA: hypothetical protein VMF91_07095 [Bryobacteraceae bacterium]|nr:hypothetical protein [Bryobacteraceae bacterium]
MSKRSDFAHASRVEGQPGAMPPGLYYLNQLSTMPARQEFNGAAMALQVDSRIHRTHKDARFAPPIPGTMYGDNGARTVVISLGIAQLVNRNREPLALMPDGKTSTSKNG